MRGEPRKLRIAKSYDDAGYLTRNLRAIELLIDQDVVRAIFAPNRSDANCGRNETFISSLDSRLVVCSKVARATIFVRSKSFVTVSFLPAGRPQKSQGDSVVFLNFFFYHVPPLQTGLWQGREEPVKALRFAPTADAALTRP